MEQGNIENLKEKIEHKGLVISRIPDWAKQSFKLWAKQEFADDYGMLLAHLIREANEYAKLKNKFLEGELPIKLSIDKPDTQEIKEDKGPTSISGKPIKFLGGKNEQNR